MSILTYLEDTWACILGNLTLLLCERIYPNPECTSMMTKLFPSHRQTGISEVFLEVRERDLEKERMRKFVEAVEGSGLQMTEGATYKQGLDSIG